MFGALKVNENGTLLKVKSLIYLTFLVSSPRMWGCSDELHEGFWTQAVFPTYVGMFLLGHVRMRGSLCHPHARGDVPVQFVMTGKIESSPRMWGCS